MRKGNKSGKRLTKKELTEKLYDFFQSHPSETFSFKQIFKALRLTTHPAKMVAIDAMDELAWDDVLAKVGENAYRLNTKGQVQEGTFVRIASGGELRTVMRTVQRPVKAGLCAGSFRHRHPGILDPAGKADV